MIVNRGTLASILDISPALLDIRRRAGLPGEKRGKEWAFDTKKVIAWLIAEATKGAAPSKKGDADLRTAIAEAELKEFKVAELRKTMLHIDDISPIFEEQAVVIKSKLNALPGRLATRVANEDDPAVVLRLIKDEVAEVLTEISGYRLRDPDKKRIGINSQLLAAKDAERASGEPEEPDEDEEDNPTADAGPDLTEDGY